MIADGGCSYDGFHSNKMMISKFNFFQNRSTIRKHYFIISARGDFYTKSSLYRHNNGNTFSMAASENAILIDTGKTFTNH